MLLTGRPTGLWDLPEDDIAEILALDNTGDLVAELTGKEKPKRKRKG